MTSPGVTSPGARYRSSSAKTAAPPKSALAKPKSGSSSAAPKHAHVVVPDASKTTPPARSTAGMQYSTWQHLEHSSTVQHPDGKTLRCDSDDWPVPVVLADRFALLSCVDCRHCRHNCIVCPLPPHQLTNWSCVRRATFITPHSPVLQAALCLAPLLSASAPPLTPFAAATAAAATTADLLSSVTPPLSLQAGPCLALLQSASAPPRSSRLAAALATPPSPPRPRSVRQQQQPARDPATRRRWLWQQHTGATTAVVISLCVYGQT